MESVVMPVIKTELVGNYIQYRRVFISSQFPSAAIEFFQRFVPIDLDLFLRSFTSYRNPPRSGSWGQLHDARQGMPIRKFTQVSVARPRISRQPVHTTRPKTS